MNTPIAEMVERMISGGIPPEFIVLAVKTAESHAVNVMGEDPVAARRRAYDRERKRNNSGGIPVEENIVSPPKKVSPITPSKNTPPSNLSPARERFREIVSAYPKRKGRNPHKPALKAYEAALARGVTHDEILAGARREHSRCSEEKIIGTPYVPQLVTWINQEGWGDTQPAEPVLSLNPGEREVEFFKNVGRWNAAYGPEPGQSGCRVPPEILEKYGYRNAA